MKYILTGPHSTNKYDVATYLETIDERFSIAEKFSSNPKYKELTEENVKYLSQSEINHAYRNNAFLTISSNSDGYYYGISMDDFYSNNVLVLELSEFNKISDSVLESNNILVVWIDSSDRTNNLCIYQDISETKGLIDRLNYIDYIYFLNEDVQKISDVIQSYEGATEEEKENIRHDLL